MEVPLKELISGIASDKRVINFDEAKTKQAIILEILYSLGWNTADPDEVTPEYWIKNFKVDYALGNKTKKLVIIEVKKPSEDLDKHQEQVVQYAFRDGAKLAILTNGMNWQFFLPHDSDENWDSKKFYDVKLTPKNAKSIAQKLSSFLLKTNVLSNKSIESAKKLLQNIKKNQKIKQSLPDIWDKLLREHNPVLIHLIAKQTQKKLNIIPTQKQIEDFIDRIVLGENSSQFEDINMGRLKSKNRISVSSIIRNSLPRKSISKLKFNGKIYPVNTYRAALFKILVIMKTKHPKDFPKILKLHGTKRLYFSTKKDELVDPKQIPGSYIYCMTNLSAESIERLIRTVLDIFNEGSFELS